jgi:hypothetical protein
MKIKMKYTKSKTDPKTQKKVKSTKTASATFTDSETSPEVLEQPEKLKGTVYQYPNHYELKVVPDNSTTILNIILMGTLQKWYIW